jgi:hypothetical protein
MHCSTNLKYCACFHDHVDDTRRFNAIQLRKKSLAIGNIKLNTIPFLRRIIYKAKMTAHPMQFKKGKLDIAKHKS